MYLPFWVCAEWLVLYLIIGVRCGSSGLCMRYWDYSGGRAGGFSKAWEAAMKAEGGKAFVCPRSIRGLSLCW